jgi:hypothetical protein
MNFLKDVCRVFFVRCTCGQRHGSIARGLKLAWAQRNY